MFRQISCTEDVCRCQKSKLIQEFFRTPHLVDSSHPLHKDDPVAHSLSFGWMPHPPTTQRLNLRRRNQSPQWGRPPVGSRPKTNSLIDSTGAETCWHWKSTGWECWRRWPCFLPEPVWGDGGWAGPGAERAEGLLESGRAGSAAEVQLAHCLAAGHPPEGPSSLCCPTEVLLCYMVRKQHRRYGLHKTNAVAFIPVKFWIWYYVWYVIIRYVIIGENTNSGVVRYGSFPDKAGNLTGMFPFRAMMGLAWEINSTVTFCLQVL